MKRTLLIMAAALLLAPPAVWAVTEKTANLNPVTITINGVFSITLSSGSVNFGAVNPGFSKDTETLPLTPLTVTAKSNYEVPWYLKIMDNAPLTRATGGTTIPNANYFHKSSGGVGVRNDAAYVAMTTAATTFYTCGAAERCNIPAGTVITCNLQVVVPNTQREGTYSNVTTYTLTVTN